MARDTNDCNSDIESNYESEKETKKEFKNKNRKNKATNEHELVMLWEKQQTSITIIKSWYNRKMKHEKVQGKSKKKKETRNE